MNMKYTWLFYLIFHLSLSNGNELNVYFIITSSSSSPWVGLVWSHLRVNVEIVENTLKFASDFEIFNLKESTLQNPVDMTVYYVPSCK